MGRFDFYQIESAIVVVYGYVLHVFILPFVWGLSTKENVFSLTTVTLAKSVGLGRTSRSPSWPYASDQHGFGHAWGDYRESRYR